MTKGKGSGQTIGDQLVGLGVAKEKPKPAVKPRAKPAKKDEPAPKPEALTRDPPEPELNDLGQTPAAAAQMEAIAADHDAAMDEGPATTPENTPDVPDVAPASATDTPLTGLEAQIAALFSKPTVEDLDEEVTVQPIGEVIVRGAMFTPYARCVGCAHLQPTLPPQTIFKGAPIKKKDGVPVKKYDCISEERCPARTFQIIFDPTTEEDMDSAFVKYVEDADMGPLRELYEKAEALGGASVERLHNYILDRMGDIKVVEENELAYDAEVAAST